MTAGGATETGPFLVGYDGSEESIRALDRSPVIVSELRGCGLLGDPLHHAMVDHTLDDTLGNRSCEQQRERTVELRGEDRPARPGGRLDRATS